MAAQQTSVSDRNAAAFPGMLDQSCPNNEIRSYWNSEASAEIPFGVAVIHGTAEDFAALKCHTSGAAVVSAGLAGIVVHSHGYSRDSELGTTGLKPGVMMGLLRKGRIWVSPEDAVDPMDAVRVRCVVAGSEVAGAFRAAADSTDCVALPTTMARWLTSCGAGGLALLEFDILGTPVAD